MHKIIIADDEEIIREGLSTGVPWDEWGFEVVGLVSDGLQVIELLNQEHPDVILTDIRMPNMDGLELAHLINEKFPNIKIVVLSGYNEAEYLQKAIKSRVFAYINKPTDFDEFEQEFLKLKEVLDKESQMRTDRKKMQKYLEESLPHMREVFFFNLLSGRVENLDNARNRMEFYNLKVPRDTFALVKIELDNYYNLIKTKSNEGIYLLLQSVVYLAGLTFPDAPFFFDKDTNSVLGICSYEQIEKNIEALQRNFQILNGLTLSAGISTPSTSLSQLPEKQQEAVIAARQKVFLGDEVIVFFEDVRDLQHTSVHEVKWDIDKIINIILNKEIQDVEKEITKIFEKVAADPNADNEHLDTVCLEILFGLERSVGTVKMTLNHYLEEKEESITDIFKIDSLSGKLEWFLNHIIGFAESAVIDRRKKLNGVVEAAIDYIEKNYMKNNLSLEAVAEAVGKNPAYLSNLFRNETGKRFIEYVSLKRVEAGKKMLEDPSAKIYEIAELTGYADVSNFNKVFRKYEGISPGEYRNAVLAGNARK